MERAVPPTPTPLCSGEAPPCNGAPIVVRAHRWTRRRHLTATIDCFIPVVRYSPNSRLSSPKLMRLCWGQFWRTLRQMRTLCIVAGAAIALTTGAALSVQATRPPAGSVSAPGASHLSSSGIASETKVPEIPSPGPASAIAVRQVHTVPILQPKATPQAHEAASPPETSKSDQRAFEPPPRDRGSVADVGVQSAPLTVASRTEENLEKRPDQPSIKRHQREAVPAGKATMTPGLSSPGDRQRRVRKAPLTAVDIIDAAEASTAAAASGNLRARAAQGTSSPAPASRRWRTISDLVTR